MITPSELLAIFYSFAFLACFLFFLGNLASATVKWKNFAGLIIFALIVTSTLPIGHSLLGQPRPHIEMMNSFEGEVLQAHMIEGEGIWLWFIYKGDTLPTYLALPWSDKNAAKLQRGVRGKGKRGKLMLTRDGSGEDEHTTNFNVIVVQPTLTPKGSL